MLMIPSPVSGIPSTYSSAFEPGIRFALDLVDIPSLMPSSASSDDELDVSKSEKADSLQPVAENAPSVAHQRYGCPIFA
jgi:hypothetical protein